MTKLLVSVKNVEEAALAIDAGVDLLDLKDPAVGALGALSIALTRDIMAVAGNRVMISATIGEAHANFQTMLENIDERADCSVDIVKIAATEWLQQPDFVAFISKKTQQVKLVAVFFGDEPFELSWLQAIADAGFYGAMLDTRNKTKPLPEHLSASQLYQFVNECARLGLMAGLAGSIGLPHLAHVLAIAPEFIGMRGGVCEKGIRIFSLDQLKIAQAKQLLLKSNKHSEKPQEVSFSALRAQANAGIV